MPLLLTPVGKVVQNSQYRGELLVVQVVKVDHRSGVYIFN